MDSEKKLIVESGTEYQLLSDGEKCSECTKGHCKNCGRKDAIGEAKVPTGRKILKG